MALTDAFPGAPGVADSVDLRKGLAGLIVRDTAGNARSGIFPRHTNSLVTGRTDMRLDVAAFEGAAVRGGGPLFIANDGVDQSPVLPIPLANSQISVLYFKQNENGYNGFADGTITPMFGIVSGVAAGIPAKPSIAGIAGAVELATITVPSTATATNSSGVVITQTYQFTAASGGMLWFRTVSERDLFSGVLGQRALVLDETCEHVKHISGWFPSAGGHSILAAKTAAQSFANGSGTLLSFEIAEARGVISASGAYTVQASGWYRITARIGDFSTNGGADRWLYITKNSTSTAGTIVASSTSAGSPSFGLLNVAAIVPLVAGDIIRPFALQNSGGTATLSTAYFSIEFVAPRK